MLSGVGMAADSLRLTVGLRMLALSCLACYFVLVRASCLLVEYQRWGAQSANNALQPSVSTRLPAANKGAADPPNLKPGLVNHSAVDGTKTCGAVSSFFLIPSWYHCRRCRSSAAARRCGMRQLALPASPSAASCFRRREWSPWSCATGSPSSVRQSNDYTCLLSHAADVLPQFFTDDMWLCIFPPTGLANLVQQLRISAASMPQRPAKELTASEQEQPQMVTGVGIQGCTRQAPARRWRRSGGSWLQRCSCRCRWLPTPPTPQTQPRSRCAGRRDRG